MQSKLKNLKGDGIESSDSKSSEPLGTIEVDSHICGCMYSSRTVGTNTCILKHDQRNNAVIKNYSCCYTMSGYPTSSAMVTTERPSQAKHPQVYQIDFTAVAAGKRIASTKRRVRW